MRVRVRAFGLLAGGFLLGSLLVPAAAQQTAPENGQVAVRSDGAVYLITNGVRRWVAPIVISDEELNAIPEGEPIYVGLMPIGSSTAPAAAAPAAAPGTAPAPAPAAAPATAPAPAAAAPATAPTSAPFRIEIDPRQRVGQGGEQKVTVRINPRISGKCSLRVEYSGGGRYTPSDADITPESKCEWSFDVPDEASAVGTANVQVTVRDTANQQVTGSATFEIGGSSSSTSSADSANW